MCIKKYGLLLLMMFLIYIATASVTVAGEVEIVMTQFTKRADTWHVGTTLRHEDSGWKHFADAWRIVDEKGKELGKRTLFHPHENEQPFTRYLPSLRLPASTKIVYVEAHDKKHGWSKQRVKVDLTKSKGDRFEVLY